MLFVKSALAVAAFWSFVHPLETTRLSPERSIVQSEPVKVSVRLPEGWSVTDNQVVPAVPLRSACQVHLSVYPDSDWNAVLAPVVRDATVSRVLHRIRGHVAVEGRKHSGSVSTELVFIDFEDVRPRTVAVWNVEHDDSAEGQQCQMSFAAMLGTTDVEP